MDNSTFKSRNITSYIIFGVFSFLVILASVFFYSHSADLTDSVFFGGDQWEYQSLAVNLIKGHGYQFGELEPFSIYRFDDKIIDPDIKKEFEESKGYQFDRAPGYPFFLAAIYRVAGIHPRVVKVVQIGLLSVAVGCLPFLGFSYWGPIGSVIGFLSAGIFLIHVAIDPAVILSESLFVFLLVLLNIFFIGWHYCQRPVFLFFMGVTCALAILVKGIGIFLPVFITVFFIIRDKSGFSKKLRVVVIFLCSVLFPILCWSRYATLKAGHFVLISQKSQFSLLDGNNEDSIKTGEWEPAWRKERQGDQRYLYNRLDPDLSASVKFGSFLKENVRDLPQLFARKFYNTFFADRFVLWVVIFMIAGLFFSKGKFVPLPCFSAVFFANLAFVSTIFFYEKRFVDVHLYFFILPAVYGAVKAAQLLENRIDPKLRQKNRESVANKNIMG